MDNRFGERLKTIRKTRGLTQARLAGSAHINLSAIAQYETGKRLPDVRSLAKLTKELAVSADWLLGLSGTTDVTGRDERNTRLSLLEKRDIALVDGLIELCIARKELR